jgi:hypothetical protein
MTPVTTWRAPLDLAALTSALQADTDATWNAGANTPQWRLYSWGPFESLAEGTVTGQNAYLISWIADDRAEIDDDPESDSNGTIVLHVRAIGFAGLQRTVELVLKRGPADNSESGSGDDGASESSVGTDGDPTDVASILRESTEEAEAAGAPRVRILAWRTLQ